MRAIKEAVRIEADRTTRATCFNQWSATVKADT